MFGQQTTKRRPDDAGRKTENSMPANGNERPLPEPRALHTASVAIR
jgi:hypothetical protein